MSDRTRTFDSRVNAFLQGQPSTPSKETPVVSEPEKPKRQRQSKPKEFDPGELKEETEKHLIKEFPDKVHALTLVPRPFLEPEGRKPYAEDNFDKLLPKPGFITDYINACRGIEAPTIHLLWAALWTVSSVLKREAWIRWYPKKLWPNLYVMIVAPPALCRKSSSLEVGIDLLRRVPALMGTTIDAYKKETTFVSSKCTPEGLVMLLDPAKRSFIDPEGQSMAVVKKGSQVAIAVSELPTFLGKQQYNQGMVNLLLDLYDCRDFDDEITRGRGVTAIENIYTTFIGAVAPEGLRLAIPEEAFGGGFMSRVVLAYQDQPTKVYSTPRALHGYPTIEELAPKLAWIANVARGEYHFTDEALRWYDEWYLEFKAGLFHQTVEQFETYRQDIILLKVAALLRMQEYRPGFDITLEHVQTAARLLDATARRGRYALEDVGAGDFRKVYNKARKILKKKGTIIRKDLLKSLSALGATSDMQDDIVRQLQEEGFLRIFLQGSEQLVPSKTGNEEYRITEEGNGTANEA